MKNPKLISVIKIGLFLSFFLNINFVSSQHLSYGNVFKHMANINNTSGHITTIENDNLNEHENILLFVTHDYGLAGPYITQPLGVWFNGSAWTIFSQDKSPMKTGAQFNVLGVNKSNDAFIHTATSINKIRGLINGIKLRSNINGASTRLNHVSLNNNPDAVFIITQNFGLKGPYNANHTGVRYSGGHWYIFNLNGRPMPEGAKFNVLINSSITKHEVNSESIQNHITYLSNLTISKNKHKRMVFATFNSRNSTKNFNNGIGVWYFNNEWTIYNENKAPLKGNEAYNILWY